MARGSRRPNALVGREGGWAWPVPDANDARRVPLAPGLPLEVVQQRGSWLLVRAPNGWQGWTDERYTTPSPASGPDSPAGSGGTPQRHSASAPGWTPALVALSAIVSVSAIAVAGTNPSDWEWLWSTASPTASVAPPSPPVDSRFYSGSLESLSLDYTQILGDFDSCRWRRLVDVELEIELAFSPDGLANGLVTVNGTAGGATVRESNLRSGQIDECPDHPIFEFDTDAPISSPDADHLSAFFILEQGITMTLSATRVGDAFDVVLEIAGGSGPTNRLERGLGSIPGPAPSPGSSQSPPSPGPTRTFEGSFDGGGDFTAGACTWRARITGIVEAKVDVAGDRVNGEATVHADAITERVGGSPVCRGDAQEWDATVPVSGSPLELTFALTAEPFFARFTGAMAGDAITGFIVVSSLDQEIRGSATIPLELSASSPP